MKWGYFNEFGEIAGPFETRELAEENAAAELSYAGDALDIVQIVTVARVTLKPVDEAKAEPLTEPDTIELVTVEEEQA